MKKLLFALLYHLGAVRLCAWRNRRTVRVLCYHGVTERAARGPQDPHGLHVRRPRFAAQLDHLRRRYNVVSLQDYLAARREGRELPPYSVVLTFDDGYRNFLTCAAPELSRRGMPATVYLITDRVREEGGDGRAPGEGSRTQDEHGGAPRWAETDDTLCLSWAEARALMSGRGVEFGSHTCTHPKLTQLPGDEAARELRRSRDEIAARLGQPSMTFAYPYGDYSPAVVERAKEAGYTCALTTDEGGNDARTDLFTLRRTLVGDDDDEAAFAVRVSGLIGWLRRGGGGAYDAPGAALNPDAAGATPGGAAATPGGAGVGASRDSQVASGGGVHVA